MQKIDGAEGWNKNISYLQSEGRGIQKIHETTSRFETIFHMGVLTGVEIEAAFLI